MRRALATLLVLVGTSSALHAQDAAIRATPHFKSIAICESADECAVRVAARSTVPSSKPQRLSRDEMVSLLVLFSERQSGSDR
jgi:hypothetical protein